MPKGEKLYPISRNNLSLFFSQVPEANKLPTVIPEAPFV